MAWKPSDKLIEGELDNTTPGKITGWLRFVGIKETVTLKLDGDFNPEVGGTKLRVHNRDAAEETHPPDRMDGFARLQTGKVVNITAGQYGSFTCIEWRSDQNGLVLLKLAPRLVRITGGPAASMKREG